MEKKDVERFAFLYLCGTKDRNILIGKVKMQLIDFYRLTYITDFLGFTEYTLSIWNQFGPQFKKRFSILDELVLDYDFGFGMEGYEEEYHQEDVWIQEFCSNASNSKIRRELRGIVYRIYKEKGIEK